MSAKRTAPAARIKFQVTFDAEVHGRLVSLLAPLNRRQRKEKLVLLIYAGLEVEALRDRAHVRFADRATPDRALGEAAETDGWKPQIEGNAFEELGLNL